MRRSGESPALGYWEAPQCSLESFSGGLPPTGFQQSDHLPCGRLRIGSQSRRSCQPINGRGRIAARQ
jgi:hypothetical protein